ncbi:DUF6445 family protein [Nitrospira sp. M1]
MDVDDDLFSINVNCDVKVTYVGHGQHKVVTADHFYRHPEKVFAFAQHLPYTNRFEIIGNFPGYRAVAHKDTQPVIQAISQLWNASLHPTFSPQLVVFSRITNNRYHLNIGQRQPHIDQDITAMIWLNPLESCAGGTGLFRHKPTNLERLPKIPNQEIRALADHFDLADEFFNDPDGYENFQNSMIFNPLFACQENRYINEGNEYWELLHLIEMKPNRLMIFDGRCFHSQYIQPEHYTNEFRVNQILYLSLD